MDGVINVYKEPGWTSGDAVAKLKGVLHERHIGHGGTLDPDAEGVLPVCVGKATRLFDYITAFRKTYVADIVFGKTTDTQDGSGKVLSETVPNFTTKQLKEALNKFTGKILQVPPMYSAIHVDGKRLYEIARNGETADIPPREVEIYSIELADRLDENKYSIRVVCGKGTYIRTLCHDIGQYLGCGAYMEHLLRESSAGLSVKNSLKISQIEEKVKNGEFDFIVPSYEAVSYMENCLIDVSQEKRLSNGNPIHKKYASVESDQLVRIWCNNKFYGIAKLQNDMYYIKCMLGEIQ